MMHTKHATCLLACAVTLVAFSSSTLGARQGTGRTGAPPTSQSAATPATTNATAETPAPPITPPPGYLIGSEDVLTITFWRDKDMSGDVTVRPDGKISVPLLNDIKAAGLTVEELRQGLVKAAKTFMDDPSVTVSVKTINSRVVFITGAIAKPGPYALTEGMTVIALIAKAGGLLEYADSKHIVVIRHDKKANGQPDSVIVNYKDWASNKNLQQNVELRPGDMVIVKS